MKRFLLAMIVLGSAQALTAQTETESAKSPFQPAETLSVTDIVSANPCRPNGTVVLDALITETGEVQKVEIRRDIACLTQLAIHAVKDWKFSPATYAGKAIASRMPVAVTFTPASYTLPDPLPTLIPQTEAAIQAEFQPAEVTRAAFPPYLADAIVFLSNVVLEVPLSAKGKVQEVKVLRGLSPLTEDAKAVVLRDWQFMPATFNGLPVRSKIILAFVFQYPTHVSWK